MMVYPMEHLPYAKGCSRFLHAGSYLFFKTVFIWVCWHRIIVLATQEAEAGGLQVQSLHRPHSGLQSEFKDSLANLGNRCLKMKKNYKVSEDIPQW